MKLIVIAVCRNEEKILPWFLRHYLQFADEIHIHDNSSTDNSRSIIISHPKTKIITYNTNGKIDDNIHISIKNEYYKSLNADWYIIVDMDEFIWCPNLHDYLKKCQVDNITLPKITGYEMIGDGWPKNDGENQLIDHIQYGVKEPWFDKFVIVHKSVDIRYYPGAHQCNPVGGNTIESPIKLLHYKFADLPTRLVKSKNTVVNLSEYNQKTFSQSSLAEQEAKQYELWKEKRVKII